MTTVSAAKSSVASEAARWGQLIFGIVCMVMIANLQYGWTLFVNPIDQKYHWGRAAIQVAFTIFVLTETWLVPFEGYLIDKFGPRVMICGSGVLVAIAWVINSMADSLSLLYVAAAIGGIGAGVDLRRLGRQRAEMVPRPARPGGRPDRGGLRRRLGADRHPDRQHDRVERLSGDVPVVRHRPGHRGRAGRADAACAASRRGCGAGGTGGAADAGATTVRPRCSGRRSSGLCMSMFVMVGAGGLMATAQLAPIANDFKIAGIPVSILGLTLPALTFALSIDRVLNGVTRPFFGWVSDHIGRENTMFIAFFLEGIGICALLYFAQQSGDVRDPVRSGVLRLGRDLLAVPGDLHRHLWPQIRDHELRHAVHRQGNGLAAGPLGNVLTVATGSWHAVFYVAAILNIVAAIMALLVLKPMRIRTMARG